MAVTLPNSPVPVSSRRARTRRRRKGDWSMLALAIPAIVFFAVFSYAPMLGVVVAFKDFNVMDGVLGSPWNGFDNFEFFVTSGAAGRVLFNTLYLNILFIAATTVVAVGIAVLINEIRLRYVKRALQSTVLLPYFISPIVISLMLQSFLQGIGGSGGVVNDWLAGFGISPVAWYSTPGVWPLILTFLKVWQTAGYFSIIYLAAITAIPADVYEAGRIDGASNARLAWSITIPLLVPTILTLLVLAVGRIFYGDFGLIYAVVGNNGALFPTTDVIDTYVFRALRQLGDFGMTAAIGLMQAVIGCILVSATLLVHRHFSRKVG